jgi:hypothetical protein
MDELDRKTLAEIWMEINSSDFPLTVDLQVWKEIKNEYLKEHIHRIGKVFYNKDKRNFASNQILFINLAGYFVFAQH